jgi:hypothetical protein
MRTRGPICLTSVMTPPDAVAGRVHLAADPLLARDERLGSADVDHEGPALDALDRAQDELPHPVLELGVDGRVLGLAQALDDDLLGGLGRDAAQVDGPGVDVGGDAQLTGLPVERALDRDVHPHLLLDCRHHGRLDGAEDQLRVDVLLQVDRLDDPQQLAVHGRPPFAGRASGFEERKPSGNENKWAGAHLCSKQKRAARAAPH